jgi:transposase-like protein
MQLTDAQLLALFDSHWLKQPCSCPQCGAALSSTHGNVLGGYVLRFKCPKGCDIPELESELDPRRSEFRDWTAREGDRLIGEAAADRPAQCPGCNVTVEGNIKWVFSGKLVHVRCPRCRRQREEAVAR